MKTLVVSLLSVLTAFNLYSQGVFFVDKQTGAVSLENVVNNTLSTNSPLSGQTYTINKQNYAIKTGTNSDITIFLSNDIFVRSKESTHLTLDNFDQSFSNIDGLPSKTRYTTFNSSLSLIEGELELVCDQTSGEENIATIATSLASIVLSKGKYVVSADDRTTIVVVLEGSATLLDNSSKKKEIVKSNHTAVVVPAPKFQGRGVETSIKRGNIFTIKETANADAESYLLNVNTVEESAKQFRFITIDKTVRGVRIN